jgi:hypothetical protein
VSAISLIARQTHPAQVSPGQRKIISALSS